MCTAINHCGSRHLFGRTLDLECSYGEAAVILPRRMRFDLLRTRSGTTHHAVMGIATVKDGIPLFYDAMNERGLTAAALNFPGNAVYRVPREGMNNVASFELIPWILLNASDLDGARELLKGTNITDDRFSADLPASPLHWIVADKTGALTVEPTSEGLRIYENRFGVLTNNPPFPYHEAHLSDFLHLGSAPPQNRLCPEAEIVPYSRGAGAVGLPGDYSSSSRFVRAVFAEQHTASGRLKEREISRFFHVMEAVSVPCGCIKTERGECVRTVYTSCADTESFTYYFTTYDCRRIRAVTAAEGERDGESLLSFPMESEEDVKVLNG